jgi:heptosyltransferase-2
LTEWNRILVRATNWVGDAVMSLPALRALRQLFPQAHIAIQARPWVADLYARESFCDQIILHHAARGARDLRGKLALASTLREGQFDVAILLQNAFEAALIVRLAGIRERIGYNRDGRGFLLTSAVPVPNKGDLPPHESYYYLELLRRAGLLDRLPPDQPIRLESADAARECGLPRLAALGFRHPVIGVSPGAAYGTAKRWLPERFAESAAHLAAELGGSVAVFGSRQEQPLAQIVVDQVAARGIFARNLAAATTLTEFIEMAAACRLYLTNDSGAMHIASALGVPTVAIFGATDHIATGPHGPLARVVREPVDCAPCLLRECPIDHRCMTRVTSERVALVALELVK